MPKRDEFMYRIDTIVSTIINVPRGIESLFDFNTRKIIKKNRELVNNYNNDFCFILGTGLSLKNQPLDAVFKYPTITTNYFHKGGMYPSKYHVFFDPAFCVEPHYSYAKQMIKSLNNTKFIVNKLMNPLAIKEGLDLERLFFVDPRYIQTGDSLRIDLSKPMTGSMNVIPFAIQCAIGMGYKKIYLLGCEFGAYGRHEKGHFYADDKEEYDGNSTDSALSMLRMSFVHMHHEAIAKYCRSHGIQIINLTPKSNISEYPAGDLAEVLEELKELNE